ncbi:hypothetical protein C8Q74DRAFT_1204594 [Fomes fomentarius]|nr:hypothetical protein C8Q74DRAFT_1204594 [Fomes fomentarius]
MRSNQVFQAPPPPPPLPQPQPQPPTLSPPQPPTLSPPQLRLQAQHAPAPSQARQQALGRIHPSHKNAIVAPRPRLPALRGPSGSVVGPRTRSTESTSAYRKHSLFYMQEGMIVLKVEGTLYKVHKYLLEHHSDFFRGFLSDGDDAMGHSDDRPIPLPEHVTQETFDCLMSFLYTGIYDPSSVSLPDWITLLRVSTRLQFTKVRQYAIREIATRRSSLPPVDAIVLAKEYDVPSWLGPAYAELVRRPTPMEDEEAERLGARTTAQVGRAREMLRTDEYALYQQRRHGARYAPPERPDEQLVARAVNEVFNLPNRSNSNPRDGRSPAPVAAAQ